ncbi:MAG TPA: hypothetical protein HPP87_08920 [Planctomycetes bacterium]|nr:hypothetical protein [Planctomycetota bacterium]
MLQGSCETVTHTDLDGMITMVCTAAKTGLMKCYGDGKNTLPYTMKLNRKGEPEPEGFSIRYAAISQIGIAKWLKCHQEDRICLPDIWARIAENFNRITHIGDFALVLWAAVEIGAENCEIFAKALADNWSHQSKLCNAVELGWVVQACTLTIQKHNGLGFIINPVLEEAHAQLVGLFSAQHSLFWRHDRPNLRESISRKIACFADQVYPVLALAAYGIYFNDRQSIEYAAEATEQICRLQGPQGQWWWHYDVLEGKICEEYPVFSVHQDAMAPMAILAGDGASGQDHSRQIELGLRWLFGANEPVRNLVHSQKGVIWRDVERCEPFKLSRKLRSLFAVAKLSGLHRLTGKLVRIFRINTECRPYHLGWILYAWADFGAGRKLNAKGAT